MSKSDSHKQGKLKAIIDDFIEPLLKQLADCPQIEFASKVRELLEVEKYFLKTRQKWDNEKISLFQDIERHIDYWKENKDDTKLLEYFVKFSKNYEKLVRKQEFDLLKIKMGVNMLKNRKHSMQEESTFSKDDNTSEVGEILTINKQENDDFVRLETLNLQQKNCLYALSIFPKSVKLRKRLLIYWWIGLRLVTSEGNTNTNVTIEHEGEKIFYDLIENGILKPVHIKKHNKTIDQCIINPIIHQHLMDFYQREGIRICCYDGPNVSALLNVDQNYLSSEEIENILGNKNFKRFQVIQLGRWSCSTEVEVDSKIVFERKKSQDHIEVDGTNFLKKLEENVTFLSLQGISGMTELPASIGKLGGLRILDLRSCHDLEKLPYEGKSRLCQRKRMWFKNLTHLDISECYLLNHMPKWICELSNLEVLKGFVVNYGGNQKQYCRLSDLSKLKKIRKLGIKIVKPSDTKYISGLESLDQLSVLTIIWVINEHKNENGKVQTIFFPKNLEKLDIRCYPEVDGTKLLGSTFLPSLRRLYIRGGKLTKLVVNDPRWELKILRLRFLNYMKIDWFEPFQMFTQLEYVEYEECPNFISFPKITEGAWDTKINGSILINDVADISRQVELKIINNREAPLDENNQILLLELTGGSYSRGPGLDLVTILDVHENIKIYGLETMRAAVLFVINKLSCIDRLSVVISLSNKSKILWPLINMTRNSKKEVEYMVNNLDQKDYSFEEDPYEWDLHSGLEMGLDILNDSSQSRVKSILVFDSSHDVSHGTHKDTSYGDVVVHTFGSQNYRIWQSVRSLSRIALRSTGGTYSDVTNTGNLIKAVAVCLAGLLTVAVQDLDLTITPINGTSTTFLEINRNETVQRISSINFDDTTMGSYLETDHAPVGSLFFKFGILYSREVRKVLVKLLLPDSDEEKPADVLKISYSYKLSGRKFESEPKIIAINRTKTVSCEKQQAPQEVIVELNRIGTIEKLYNSSFADIDAAKEILKDSNDELRESMKVELQGFARVTDSNFCVEFYPSVLSLFTSHLTQRAAVRGLYVEESIRLFGTPAMLQFLKDAENMSKKFRTV